MTRDEIREMLNELNADVWQKHGWEEVVIPNPEPAYWDNFPHLVKGTVDKHIRWEWKMLLEGRYEPKPCDACEQVVWERERIWSADTHIEGVHYYVSYLCLCLPCSKAIDTWRGIIVAYAANYEGAFLWDLSHVVPSEGMFTNEFWLRKGKINHGSSPEERCALCSLYDKDHEE